MHLTAFSVLLVLGVSEHSLRVAIVNRTGNRVLLTTGFKFS